MLPELAAAIALAAAVPDAPPHQALEQSEVLIPPTLRAMIDAALAGGNEDEVSTVVKFARVADPASGDAVLALAERWRADRAAQHRAVLEQAHFFNLWSGKMELGGYITTGNSDTAGVSALADLTREGLRWRHKFRAQVDYQETNGVPAREHYLAVYEPNYKFDDRGYVYGQLQYESDRFLGYYDRVSASSGLGYSVVKSAPLTLDLELGPAYRHTGSTDDTTQNSLAARGSADLNWRLTRWLSLHQTSSAYVERYHSTVSSMTALNAKLLGPLAAKLSYNVQYESMPPLGSQSTDTATRAALVYSF